MMKNWNDKKTIALVSLAVVLGLLFTVEAFSQSSVGLDFPSETILETSTNIYRQESRQEAYESTCEREVATGTHEVCSSGRTERRCRKVPGVGDECWDETEEVCSTETTYETETYSCTRYETVTYDVFDYLLKTKVKLVKSSLQSPFDLSKCILSVSPNKRDETYSAFCSEALVKLNKVTRVEVRGSELNNQKERTVTAELDFLSFKGLEAIKEQITSLSFDNQNVVFYATDLKNVGNFKLNFKIVRNRFLLKDKVLFSKEISPNQLVDLGNHPTNLNLKKWSLNLKTLMGGIQSTKKHTLTLSLGLIKKFDLSKVVNEPRPIDNQVKTLIVNE
jgi:hypothetical protein